MSNGSQKYYLFVSNQCPHSRQILNQLRNTQISKNLNVINIDDPRIQIPNFIQCVPTLYLPDKRQVLTEQHLIQYFQMMTFVLVVHKLLNKYYHKLLRIYTYYHNHNM